jgi:hypothetical protein
VAGGANEARLAAQPYLIGCDEPDWQVVPLTLNAGMVRSLSQCGLGFSGTHVRRRGTLCLFQPKAATIKNQFCSLGLIRWVTTAARGGGETARAPRIRVFYTAVETLIP